MAGHEVQELVKEHAPISPKSLPSLDTKSECFCKNVDGGICSWDLQQFVSEDILTYKTLRHSERTA